MYGVTLAQFLNFKRRGCLAYPCVFNLFIRDRLQKQDWRVCLAPFPSSLSMYQLKSAENRVSEEQVFISLTAKGSIPTNSMDVHVLCLLGIV